MCSRIVSIVKDHMHGYIQQTQTKTHTQFLQASAFILDLQLRTLRLLDNTYMSTVIHTQAHHKHEKEMLLHRTMHVKINFFIVSTSTLTRNFEL